VRPRKIVVTVLARCLCSRNLNGFEPLDGPRLRRPSALRPKPGLSLPDRKRIPHCQKRNRLGRSKSRRLSPRSGLAGWQRAYSFRLRRKGNVDDPVRAGDISRARTHENVCGRLDRSDTKLQARKRGPQPRTVIADDASNCTLIFARSGGLGRHYIRLIGNGRVRTFRRSPRGRSNHGGTPADGRQLRIQRPRPGDQ
jgi:hypothetical protein